MQKFHISRWHFHFHQKIRSGKRKQHRNLLGFKQGCIYAQQIVFIVGDGQGKWIALVAADDLSKNVGAFVAVKRRMQYLQMQIDFFQWPFLFEVFFGCTHDVGDVALFVGKGNLPIEMGQHFIQAAF